MAEYPLTPARRVAGRVVAWTLGAVLAVFVLAAAWIGVRGYLAYTHLQDARAQAADVTAALSDPASAGDVVARVSADTSAARELTSDPVWRLAEGLPWLGAQLSAVATVTAAVDDVASDAVRPLTDAAASFSLDSLRPTDGRFDLAALAALREPAATTAERLRAAADDIDAVRTEELVAPLRAPVSDVQDLLDEVAGGADALERATALMPEMLGANGPRNYLVLFQNNAEWRSLGGIAGAMAVVHTEDGRISLAGQGNTTDFRDVGAVTPLPPELQQVFGTRPTRFIQNVTQVPDFTVGAPIAREMWRNVFGLEVDGVVAIDPVALSYLLEATGPVTLATGDVLSADTAVPLLLNEVYLRYPNPREQDAFFAAATAAVFGVVSSGDTDPKKLVEALTRAGQERRLALWNADPAAQAVLDGTSLQARLPESDDETTRFGVYLNDSTGSKMDYYMRAATSVGWCTDTEGAPEAELTVRLRSDAPADAASLPDYITGDGSFGTHPGSTETLAYVYLPPDAEVVGAVADGSGGATGFGGGYHEGRRVLTWSTVLAPGEEAVATVRVRTSQTPRLEAVVTPLAAPLEDAGFAPACSATGE